MPDPAPRRRAGRVPYPFTLPAALILGLLAAAPALAAPNIRPWLPPGVDSLTVWAAEARVRFQSNTGDTVGGSNFRPYDLVGTMGRSLLASLGREGMVQAHAVEGVLDSLGLDTDIVTDPQQPGFVLLMVRNPYHAAAAVGFLYWYRARDLREQGVVFHATHAPRMRVWWTATNEWPYEWAIVTDNPDDDDRMSLLLLRLNEQATYWVLVQYENSGPDLGTHGDVAWVDVNREGGPELFAWTQARADTTFEECRECPHLRLERMFVLRPDGYELWDARLLPSPYSTFTLFIRLLQQQNRAAAQKLLYDPARVSEAIAAGWAKRGKGAWLLESATEGESWPDRLGFRFNGPKGAVRYAVHFVNDEGRWLIRDWVTPQVPPSKAKGIRP